MADIKISELLPASTPLDGTETLPIVQSGNTVKASTQDIASLYSLGYTAENVTNKSTDSSFAGATDLKYPSQLAVKTYVDNTLGNAGWSLTGNSGTTSANFIGTTDNKNVVFKANNFNSLTLDAATGYVDVKSKLRVNVSNTVYAQLDSDSNKGRLVFYNSNATAAVTLNCANLTTSRTLQLPDASGTLVATINNTPPDSAGNVNITEDYKVYSALGYYSSGTFTVTTELKNTLGTTITWGNNGTLRTATAGTNVFTSNKTVITATPIVASSVSYNNIGSRSSDTVVTLSCINNTTGSVSYPFSQNIFVEIRVYL